MYYFNARWYDPELGRFVSEDPAADPNIPNLYSYCANNPGRFSDPKGLDVGAPGRDLGTGEAYPGSSSPKPSSSGGGGNDNPNKPPIPEFKMPDIPHFKEPKLPESKPETEFDEDGSITQTWVNSDRTTTVVRYNKDGQLALYYVAEGSYIKSSITIHYDRNGSPKEVNISNNCNKDGSRSFSVTHFKDGKISNHTEGNSKTGYTIYQYCYKDDKQYYYKTTLGLDGRTISTKSNIPYTNYSVFIGQFFGVQVGALVGADGKTHPYIGIGGGFYPSGSITIGKDAQYGLTGSFSLTSPSWNSFSGGLTWNHAGLSGGFEKGYSAPGASGYIAIVF